MHAPVKASTCQSNEARRTTLFRPSESSQVIDGIAHIATSKPSNPPPSERMTLSVSNWRITRRRPAPRLRRIAISRLRAVALASSKFAMFAHAMKRIRPTMDMST